MEAAADAEIRNSLPRKSIGRPRKSQVANTAVPQASVSLDELADDEEIDQFEELFASLMNAFDPRMDQRPLYPEFQLLPSRKLYPDYYSIIEQPIDLKAVASKIQQREYDSLDDMEHDLLLMVKNACTYNDPESQIYQDARALKDVFTAKKLELETGRAVKTQFKRRGQSLSAMTAALREDDDMDEDDLSNRRTEAIMMRLFNTLNNHPNPLSKDEPIGATLWRMPHPRWEKSFYENITRPISMSQIQQKIKKGVYRSFGALKADFEQMCTNYLTACKPEHRLHIASIEMKKILDATFAPVIEQQQQTSASGGSSGNNSCVIKEESDTMDTDTSSVMSTSNNTSFSASKKKANTTTALPPPPTPAAIAATTITPTAPATATTGTTPGGAPRTQIELTRIPPQAKAKLNFHNALVKNKLLQIHRFLIDYMRDGRYPIENFVEIPPAIQYPDYYEIIASPIDTTMIEANIKGDKYASIEEAVTDYRRMFANCRKYNQEGSLIVDDANLLEKLLVDKAKEVSNAENNTTTIGVTTIKKITTNGWVLRFFL